MEEKDHYLLAIFSLILGIISLVAWFLPICGLPLAITGLVFGLVGKASSQKGFAIAGIVLNIIGLVFVIGNAAIGMYLGATGQLFSPYGGSYLFTDNHAESQAHVSTTPQPKSTSPTYSDGIGKPTSAPIILIATLETPVKTQIYLPQDCREWSEISLADFGQEECVYGVVRDTYDNEQAYFITFGRGDDDFYFLSYDWYFPDVKMGSCVVATGKIERLGDNPVMVITRNTTLYDCK